MHKTGKKEEGERKKGEEGKEEDKKKYTYHDQKRVWKDVGKRCKLVVDSQTTANLFNRQVECRNVHYDATVRHCLNMQHQIVKSGWLPYQDFDNLFGVAT